MRRLIVSVFTLLAISSQAHACRAPQLWNSIFFEHLPRVDLNSDLVAKVALSDVKVDNETSTVTAIATVVTVHKVSDRMVHPGETLLLRYSFSSCGPDHKAGDMGTIIAKVDSYKNDRLVFRPYLHDGRDQVTLPSSY